MSFGFIAFNLSCLKCSNIDETEVYACDNSLKPSLRCFLDDHTLCPYLKWDIVPKAELLTDNNGNVIKCNEKWNKDINSLVVMEGYCFHDEDDNYKKSDVACYGSDIVSNDCVSKTSICKHFGWCHMKNINIKTDLNGNVIYFNDNPQ